MTATWSGLWAAHVGDQPGERRHVARAFALALPVDVAHEPLEPHLVEARQRHGPEMDIGEMGDGEAHRRVSFAHWRLGEGLARFAPRGRGGGGKRDP